MNRYVIREQDLIDNIQYFKQQTTLRLMGVVKGNAYGFGLNYMASLLVQQGIDFLAVTELRDLITLRQNGITCDILLLKPVVTPEDAWTLITQNGIATVSSLENAALLQQVSCATPVRVHLKINTGLNRFGLDRPYEQVAAALMDFSSLEYEGIYTHFSNAFSDRASTLDQYSRLLDAKHCFEKLGFTFREVHCANTEAFLNIGAPIEKEMTTVRIGSGWCGRVISDKAGELKRAGMFYSQVAEVRHLEKGDAVSYGGTFHASSSMDIAIIEAGYTDGLGKHVENGRTCAKVFFRSLLSQLRSYLKKEAPSVQIDGKRCPILGYLNMTNAAVDVTDMNITPGTPVQIDLSPIHVDPLVPREILR